MRQSSIYLNSRFGRRMFLLFAGCALLPILGLALVSYTSVNRELIQQAEDRVAETSKSMVMGIWERLSIVDAELQIIAARLDSTTNVAQIGARSILGESLSRRMRGILVGTAGRNPRVIWGIEFSPPELTREEVVHLESGSPLLRILDRSTGAPQILLGRVSAVRDSEPSMIWAEIEPAYLWWGAARENTMPARNELVVLDPSRDLQVFSTLPGPNVLPEETRREIGMRSHSGTVWQSEGTDFLGHFRTVGLPSAFHHPFLTVVVGEPKDSLVQPLATFKRGFLGVLLATLVVVMLLSIRQIRSSLIPLQKLREGTGVVASGNFSVGIEVASDDEFAELAESFNAMAGSLERQFATLTTLNRLQEVFLSALDVDRMVTTVLEHFGQIFPCEQVAVCVMKPDCGEAGWLYQEMTSSIPSAAEESIDLSSREIAAFKARRHYLEIDLSEGHPSFSPRGASRDLGTVVAFPAFLEDELAAVVVAGCVGRPSAVGRDFEAARQLTDQVAIGLFNIRLIHELDDLNWGTLSALARAIDVRSSWTMGHTERVTSLAQQIGRSMGLSNARRDNLHRGGLLHDIGKIGVPSHILDKPGSLTPEEMDQVRQHVRLGGRIIEPIPALAEAVPIVLQHHEWFNGQGYPAGLVGYDICLEARILAVADCYDALRSERPYRRGLSHEEVMQYLGDGAGKQFDPEVVEVFVQIMVDTCGPQPPDIQVPDLNPPLMAI